MSILGWVLILLGVMFNFLGFAGALREIVKGTIRPVPTRGAEQYARLIEAVTDLIRALTAAPQWLALVAVGLILIVMGAVFAFPGEATLSILLATTPGL